MSAYTYLDKNISVERRCDEIPFPRVQPHEFQAIPRIRDRLEFGRLSALSHSLATLCWAPH